MKTLKLTFAVLALLFVGAAANTAHASDKPSKTDVVNIYIDAISSGKTQDVNKVLDDDMKFNMLRGENVNTVSKDNFLKSLNNAGPSTPLNTNTTVMQDDDDSQKVKIEFKYDGFIRTDVVTLNKAASWRITSVESSYK